ncbi:unnamed protein product [Linum tenue]|uniref:DUF7950 domain-containing protein n=1 Tax=Linum tenue TaxID=586396 RepID=A0AAV0NDU8_9ROSI|nr:unnamed protein product [Linum tenue]
MDGGGGDGYRLMNFASGRVQEEEPTIISRMMLRFRPIAPKPAAGAGSGSSAARLVPKVRTKRKYVRVRAAAPRKKNNNNDKNSNSRVGGDGGAAADLGFVQLPATLQLLPEAAKLDRHRSDVRISDPVPTLPVEDNSNSAKNNRGSSEDSYGAAVLDPETAEVETWVTAEGVTGGCMDVAEGQGLLGIRMMDLQDDTCPAFVSDGKDKVRWVNQAYREMVGAAAGEKGGGGNKVVVRLVVAEKLRPYFQGCPAFSCWVGVRFRDNSNNNGKWSNVRFPCDVWKMEEEGWYGWRLDTKVALKLGL